MARDCVIEIVSESKEKKATLDESFLKGLAESLEKTRKNNERSAEELSRT